MEIAAALDFSKASVSVAMKQLRENGYVEVDAGGYITLTSPGMEIAQRIYERHQVLTNCLVALGVSEEVAAEDACRVEHFLSAESFDKIRAHYEEKIKKRSSLCCSSFLSSLVCRAGLAAALMLWSGRGRDGSRARGLCLGLRHSGKGNAVHGFSGNAENHAPTLIVIFARVGGERHAVHVVFLAKFVKLLCRKHLAANAAHRVEHKGDVFCPPSPDWQFSRALPPPGL